MIYKIFSAPSLEVLEEQLSSRENNKYEPLNGFYGKGQFHALCVLKGYAEKTLLKNMMKEKDEEKENA